MEKKSKLGASLWINLIVFGLMGQIAWNLENVYFNTFLYNSVYAGASQNAIDGSIKVMDSIAIMVAASAATAVITTFLIGALSDKLGKRKVFISAGYILWGLVTASFGLVTRENTAALFHLTDETAILTATISIVIALDCVMTFMGSTSNDACFNAWVTDVTTTKNRATSESVLAILGIATTVIVMALAGLIDSIGYNGFFISIGLLVSVCGIMGIFTIKESGDGVKKSNPYLKDLVYGFKPSVIKANKRLYLELASVGVFSVAVQVFFPYLFIYVFNVLAAPADSAASADAAQSTGLPPWLIIVAVIGVIGAVALVIFMGKLIDKLGKDRFVIISVVLFIAGLVLASFAKNLVTFIVFALPVAAGYGLLMIMLNAAVRDFTPPDKTGLFQGVRMIFFVLIPMVVGPSIGKLVCQYSSFQYTTDYGVVQDAPGAAMFLASAVVGIFILIPVLKLKKLGFNPEKTEPDKVDAV